MADLSSINDEEQLQAMLSQTQDFEERKRIRGRIKEVRAAFLADLDAKKKQREAQQEEAIKKKHREADEEKRRKLAAYQEQAKAGRPEDARLAYGEKQLRERMKAADLNKQKQLEMYDQLAGKDVSQKSTSSTNVSSDGRTTTTTRKVETVTKVGGAGARPGAGRGSAKNMFKQMDAKTNPAGAAGRGGGALMRSPSAIKTMLLEWCKAMTREYKDKIDIQNFSTSWNDGLAFCALIHHFYPDSFDFDSLNPKDRRKNFELAFDTAEKVADIAPLLDVEDMVMMKKPDWKCVFTYVQSFYRKLQNHERNKAIVAADS